MTISFLTNLSHGTQTKATEIPNFFDRLRSYIKAKAIERSITKNMMRNLGFIVGYMNRQKRGGVISNYGPTMLELIFKIINLDTRIGVSNLKYDIETTTLPKFGNYIKYLLDDISSN